MGAKLVGAAFMYWADLPDRPFRLLTHMALTCKDAAEAPVYYAGRTALVAALGLRDDDAGHHAVKRAMRVLTTSGAVSIYYLGHQGKRTEYQLHVLDRLRQGGTPAAPLGGTPAAPLNGNRGPLTSGKSRIGGTPAAPLGTELQEEELQENNRKNSSSTEGEYRGRRVKSEPKTYPSADDILARAAAKRVAV